MKAKDKAKEVDSLKAAIIAKLKAGKKYGAIRIVTNEETGGFCSLVLHGDGSWSGKFGLSGYDLGKNPSLNNLLEEYALIKDAGYGELEDISEEGITAREKYVQGNSERLLDGLIAEMKKVLKNL